MSRGDEVDLELELLFDDMAWPGALHALERYFWLELWHVPLLEAIDEQGIEARHYGPVRAFAFPHKPRIPLFNLLLGADRPGAVEGAHLAEALDWTESLGGSTAAYSLPGQRDWRTYVATDSEGPLAAAAMMMHYETPQLGFAGTLEEGRGRGAHMALLHRRIEDARAAGAGQLFAVTEESLECPDALSAGARNLIRAGFALVDVRTVWQPPEELIAPPEGLEDEQELGGDDWDDDDGDDGPGEDHGFVLGG